MRIHAFLIGLITLWIAQPSWVSAQENEKEKDETEWSCKATIIEACSCPMFCQCYFNSKPAAPGCCPASEAGKADRYCRFNNAFKVDHGKYGKTKLDGALFWVAGDLGGDFTKGQMNWATVTFDPSATPEQRAGLTVIIGHIYPVKWSSLSVAKDAKMEWKATKDRAEARLDEGKTAEVVLKRNQGMTDEPIVIHNLKYWGVPRNSGFIMMQNEVEAYRAGEKSFEFKGTNGFMISIDLNSSDVKAAKSKDAEAKDSKGGYGK